MRRCTIQRYSGSNSSRVGARDNIVLNLDMKAGSSRAFRRWTTVRLVQRRGGDEMEPQRIVSGLAEAVTLLGNSTCSSGHESCLERTL